MNIGDRLRALREQKKVSQGEIEKRSGLLRCYISRVENGHGVPSVETLEKFARALEVPVYHLVYDGEEPPEAADVDDTLWGNSGKDARILARFRQLFGKMTKGDRDLLLEMAAEMAKRKATPGAKA